MLGNLVLFCVGLVLCFFGYKCFRVMLSIVGAIGGGALGEYIYTKLCDANILKLTGTGNIAVHWIFVIFLALFFGCIAFALYKKAVIIITMICFCLLLCVCLSSFSWIIIVIGLVLGLIAGILVFCLQKGAIIITTAAMGSMLITNFLTDNLPNFLGLNSIASFFDGNQIGKIIWFVVVGAILVSGIVVQNKSNKDKEQKNT